MREDKKKTPDQAIRIQESSKTMAKSEALLQSGAKKTGRENSLPVRILLCYALFFFRLCNSQGNRLHQISQSAVELA